MRLEAHTWDSSGGVVWMLVRSETESDAGTRWAGGRRAKAAGFGIVGRWCHQEAGVDAVMKKPMGVAAPTRTKDDHDDEGGLPVPAAKGRARWLRLQSSWGRRMGDGVKTASPILGVGTGEAHRPTAWRPRHRWPRATNDARTTGGRLTRVVRRGGTSCDRPPSGGQRTL